MLRGHEKSKRVTCWGLPSQRTRNRITNKEPSVYRRETPSKTVRYMLFNSTARHSHGEKERKTHFPRDLMWHSAAIPPKRLNAGIRPTSVHYPAHCRSAVTSPMIGSRGSSPGAATLSRNGGSNGSIGGVSVNSVALRGGVVAVRVVRWLGVGRVSDCYLQIFCPALPCEYLR